MPLSTQLRQQLVQQHHLAAGRHQRLDLAGAWRPRPARGRSSRGLAGRDVVLNAVAQVLRDRTGSSGRAACFPVSKEWTQHSGLPLRRVSWARPSNEQHGTASTSTSTTHLWLAARRLTGWQQTLRSSMARFRMLGMFFTEAPAISCMQQQASTTGAGQGRAGQQGRGR